MITPFVIITVLAVISTLVMNSMSITSFELIEKDTAFLAMLNNVLTVVLVGWILYLNI